MRYRDVPFTSRGAAGKWRDVPYKSLVPYHAKRAHVLFWGEGLSTFLHTHPAGAPTRPEAVLEATLVAPRAGRYALQVEVAVACSAIQLCVAEEAMHLHTTPYSRGWLKAYGGEEIFAVTADRFELQVGDVAASAGAEGPARTSACVCSKLAPCAPGADALVRLAAPRVPETPVALVEEERCGGDAAGCLRVRMGMAALGVSGTLHSARLTIGW